MKPFKLGPKQRRWLAALTSGKFKQAQSTLYVRNGNSHAYCCLGVANRVLNLGEPAHNGSLESTYDKLGLRGQCGEATGNADSLATLNDSKGLTFKQIAATIRKHPRRYFARAV